MLPIITISRQYGSGGHEVGERLAKKLNIPLLDKELIAMAAQQSGLSEEVFERADEKASSSFGEAAGVLRGDGGKHSIVKKGKELEDLGVKLKKRLAVPKRFQCDENALENVPEVIEIDSGNAAEESNK